MEIERVFVSSGDTTIKRVASLNNRRDGIKYRAYQIRENNRPGRDAIARCTQFAPPVGYIDIGYDEHRNAGYQQID